MSEFILNLQSHNGVCHSLYRHTHFSRIYTHSLTYTHTLTMWLAGYRICIYLDTNLLENYLEL